MKSYFSDIYTSKYKYAWVWNVLRLWMKTLQTKSDMTLTFFHTYIIHTVNGATFVLMDSVVCFPFLISPFFSKNYTDSGNCILELGQTNNE